MKKKAIDLKIKDVVAVMPKIIIRRGKNKDDRHEDRQEKPISKTK
jgi:hypothetical protein